MTLIGSHGSLERTPGALFRAMETLFLRKKDCIRVAPARDLQEHHETLGVHYHVRTLKRQLRISVPPAVQGATRHVLLRANGLQTGLDIETALSAARIRVSSSDGREPKYLSSGRTVPLAQRWLLVNPTHSRRSRATVLSERLACRGVQLKVAPLQSNLGGRQMLARREVHAELLALLSAYGIASEAKALARWLEQRNDIASDLQNRILEPTDRLVALSRFRSLRNQQSLSRRPVVIVQQKLRGHRLARSVHRTQETLNGKPKRVRRLLLVEMEGLLREALPGDRDHG